MPYQVRKCSCKDSKGKKGKYIVTKKGKNKQLSCHASKAKAKAAIRARYVHELESVPRDHRMIAEKVFEALLYETTKKKRYKKSRPN